MTDRIVPSGSKIFYVYIHRRKTDDNVFYVGKGHGNRAWSKHGRNTYWKRVAEKHGFYVEIIRSDMLEKDSFDLEVETIASIGIDNLTNLTQGGEGLSGYRFTEEQRNRMKGRVGPLSPKFGKPTPPEVRRKIGDAQRGHLNHQFGKVGELSPSFGLARSDETRKRQRYAAARNRTDQYRAKMSESKKRTAPRGSDHPAFDHRVHRFFHEDHGVVESTRYDWIKMFDIHPPLASCLINGSIKSTKGWRLFSDENTQSC